MGLDMYLYRTKKVEGYTAEDYYTVDDTVCEHVTKDADVAGLNLETITGISKANELLPRIKNRGEYFTWYSIFEEVGYWRKANQIHRWFVENVQDGIDECQPSLVTKERLEELLRTVKQVLEDFSKARELLPTQSGFFFGSTDYDEWYKKGLEHTVEVLEKVLAETDFDNEVILYRSSW